MAIKDILIQIDELPASPNRLQLAIHLAHRLDARLIGAFLMPTPDLVALADSSAAVVALAATMERLKQAAGAAEASLSMPGSLDNARSTHASAALAPRSFDLRCPLGPGQSNRARNLLISRYMALAPRPAPARNPAIVSNGTVFSWLSTQFPASAPSRVVTRRTIPISEKRAR